MTCNVDTRELRHRPGLHDFLRQTKDMGVEQLKHVEPTVASPMGFGWLSGSSLCCMALYGVECWNRLE